MNPALTFLKKKMKKISNNSLHILVFFNSFLTFTRFLNPNKNIHVK